MVNGIRSAAPSSGSPWFSAGMPGGLANVMSACGGPVGSRPSRPATYGRVEGLTAKRKRPPGARYVVSSTSV